ncbi:MAG TPA: biotin/lipoyl-containing protein [Gemmatimonadales bacterium]|nr:biotin/lipoyl-containing protein [Gemmatimonadales bacterium]
MKYVVVVDGQTIEVEVDGERVTVAGRAGTATLSAIPGTPLRQLLFDGRPTVLSVESLGAGRWALAPDGERWEVEVLDERTRHIRSLTSSGDRQRAAPVLKAPMPGLVLRVQVAPGQRVLAGAGLVVLEAMKMENELKATAPAIVKTVRVQAGSAVEKGQVLLEFEGLSGS